MGQFDLERTLRAVESQVSRHATIFDRVANLLEKPSLTRDDLIKALRDRQVWAPTYQDWADERNNAVARADERDEYARRLKECEAQRDALQAKLTNSEAEVLALKETLEGINELALLWHDN